MSISLWFLERSGKKIIGPSDGVLKADVSDEHGHMKKDLIGKASIKRSGNHGILCQDVGEKK